MDSITQIILGAACGEAVAGRKIGNRAMLWGAVGGTIPDLDVLSSLVADEMTALAFHRGIMHSLLFACIFPWVIAWAVHKLYERDIYRRSSYKKIGFSVSLFLLAGVVFVANIFPIWLGKPFNFTVFGISVAVTGALAWRMWRRWVTAEQEVVNYHYLGWVHLFFWSILTHPILDAFTGYGTQLFQPFSDYRVQWDTVSIVDPLYTVPFAMSLFICGKLLRSSHWRRLANWGGIAVSCAYLGYTINHKMRVNEVFRQSLAAQNIDYKRFTTGPTIFNNILWKGTIEADSCYYFAMWGFNDSSDRISQFTKLPKNHHLATDSLMVESDLRTLKWFSDGYYNVIEENGERYLNDLRFGLMGEQDRGLETYIFSWKLVHDSNHGGRYVARQYNEPRGDASAAFSELKTRIKGK
jgi:inner membrane protein